MNQTTTLTAFACAALFTAIALAEGSAVLALVRLAVFGAAVGAVALIDLREHRIPNRIVLPAAAVCALLSGPATLRQSVPALALVGGLLVLAFLQPAALGMGDVKEALLIAVALGTLATPALLVGITLAAVAGVLLTLRRGRAALGVSLPLAPFLAAGAAIALAI
jgi:leader peptidase (prepilin peptidase) / N-methyltransferase